MCLYTRFEYDICQHLRKAEVKQECAFPGSMDCMVQTEETDPTKITTPSFCPDCFRNYLDVLCRKYDESLRTLELQLRLINEKLSNGETSFGQATLEKQQRWAMDEIDRVKATKRQAIKVFMDEQGVWADG